MICTPVTRVSLGSSCIVSESADSAADPISAVSEAQLIFKELFEAALSYVGDIANALSVVSQTLLIHVVFQYIDEF
jgi:hypothetical protein